MLHAGDLHVIDVLDWLEPFAPVLCARGNGDPVGGDGPSRPGVPEDLRVSPAHVLTLGNGLTLGMVHTFGFPAYGSFHGIREAMQEAFGRAVDVVVCGDTHVPLIYATNYQSHKVVVINPGSPTMPWGLTGTPGTMAMLEVTGEGIHTRLLSFEGPSARG